MSAPFGNRTRGMADTDILATRREEDGIWQSLQDPAWQMPQPGHPVPRFPAGGLRERRALHLGPLSPEQVEHIEAALRRGESQASRLEHGTAIDLPDDFDREIMTAVEEAHPRRTYWRDTAVGLLGAGCAVIAFACIRATALFWL